VVSLAREAVIGVTFSVVSPRAGQVVRLLLHTARGRPARLFLCAGVSALAVFALRPCLVVLARRPR
jgi:hypothetical protein